MYMISFSHCLQLLCDGDGLVYKTEIFSGRCEYELYVLLMS